MRLVHDTDPPAGWPPLITYLTKSRLSPTFPPSLIPFLFDTAFTSCRQSFAPCATTHPIGVQIKKITIPTHPAFNQNGLFARKKFNGRELVIPYLGIIHASLTASSPSPPEESSSIDYNNIDENAIKDDLNTTNPSKTNGPILHAHLNQPDEHANSDYDLSLLRLSSSDSSNPFSGYHISIGVDAARAGNAARFVNDFRGIRSAPNAEFRLGRGERGELRMEIWSLKCGIGKGDEILVSYGKGWWGARND